MLPNITHLHPHWLNDFRVLANYDIEIDISFNKLNLLHPPDLLYVNVRFHGGTV